MNRARASLVVAGLLGSCLVGCGVPLQDAAQGLPPGVIPPPVVVATPSPTAVPSPTPSPVPTSSPAPPFEVVDLYFIQDNSLVPLVGDVPAPADPQAVLDLLAAGAPIETGLRSIVLDPLTGTPLVGVFAPADDADLPIADVTVAVAPVFSSLPPAEQVLLLGQVVLSLSSAEYLTVGVVDETGSPLAVPLPDGRLLDRPATALDYVGLRTPR